MYCLSIWKGFKDIGYQNSLVQDDNGRFCKDPKNAFSTLKDEGKAFLVLKKSAAYIPKAITLLFRKAYHTLVKMDMSDDWPDKRRVSFTLALGAHVKIPQ